MDKMLADVAPHMAAELPDKSDEELRELLEAVNQTRALLGKQKYDISAEINRRNGLPHANIPNGLDKFTKDDLDQAAEQWAGPIPALLQVMVEAGGPPDRSQFIYPLKVVVSAGSNDDYALYVGPAHWSDDRCWRYGTKAIEVEAGAILDILRRLGLSRDDLWDKRKYRK